MSSIELKRQIQSHIKDTVSKFHDREQEYQVSLVLKDNAVATGIDFNPLIAKDKALDTAVQYGLKQGWIKEVSPYFSFSKALELIKQGNKITRKGWNGKDQWIAINGYKPHVVSAYQFWSKHNAEYAKDNGGTAEVLPCFTLKNAQGQIVMGWIPSTGDLLAEDWMIAE